MFSSGFTISVNVKPLVGAGEEGKELGRPNKGVACNHVEGRQLKPRERAKGLSRTLKYDVT
jgi:hypothetical protein